MATTAHKTAGAACAPLSAGGYGKVRPFAGDTRGTKQTAGDYAQGKRNAQSPAGVYGCSGSWLFFTGGVTRPQPGRLPAEMQTEGKPGRKSETR